MSKTLLSRIKPLHIPKRNPSPPFRFPPRLKILITETIQILKTHPQWPDSLETRFCDEETCVSEVAHYVFDHIHDVELGIKFFDWVSKQEPQHFPLNELAHSSFLKLLARFRLFSEIETALENMKMEEIKPTHEALSFIVRVYVDSGFVDKALELFYSVVNIYNSVPNVSACNSLLNSLVELKKVEIAHKVFDEMVEREGCVDNYSVCIMVKGLCKVGKVEEGKKLVEDRWGEGCVPNVVFYNTLIDGCSTKRDVQRAKDLFKELKMKGFLPTLKTYGAMINGFCKKGDFKEIDKLLKEMKEMGLGVNTQGEVDVALMIRHRMVEKGVLPDAGIYNVLMNGLCKKGRFSAAKVLLAKMLDQNVTPDAFVYATLVDGFIRNGDLLEAKKLFEIMIKEGMDPGTVGYNAMIKGFCKFGQMKEALLCVTRMMEVQVTLDEYTYSTIIDGYIKHHDMYGALRVFGQMVKRKCKPNVVTYTSLINGFCRSGDFNTAENAFKEMRSCGLEPNVVTYTILIGSFCKEGKLAKAVFYFELMLSNKCMPNDITFHYVVNGFSNSPTAILDNQSLEKKSLFIESFNMMIFDGSAQRAAVYNSVLLCLCQNGMTGIAFQLKDKITNKGFVPDPVSFAAFLHGICLEGKSKEWRKMISNDLNEQELQTALKYSQLLNQYLPYGITSGASPILKTLIKDCSSRDQNNDLIVSVK
ncbi:hypothetical protein POUND7_003617 [Theobroma cacao]